MDASMLQCVACGEKGFEHFSLIIVDKGIAIIGVEEGGVDFVFELS